MLQFRNRVGPSTLGIDAGLGLFTLEDLKAGQVLWVDDPMATACYTKEQYESVHPAFRDLLKEHAFVHNGMFWLSIDNSRFINHSDTPNSIQGGPDKRYMVAARDITAGEEIFEAYDKICDVDERERLIT